MNLMNNFLRKGVEPATNRNLVRLMQHEFFILDVTI